LITVHLGTTTGAAVTTTAEQHLTAVITAWPQLTDLLTTRSSPSWPPADRAAYLRQLDQHDAAEVAAARAADEGPLVLRETGAPLRLHVLDTMRMVTIVITTLADQIAAEVQRAPITSNRPSSLDPQTLEIERLAALDARDPDRWRHNRSADTSPVAAAEWLLARLTGEAGPCTPLTIRHREQIDRVAAEAARRIARVLGTERRHDPMPRPCPWSGGLLTLHHGGDQPEHVTCEHGYDCAAPVLVYEGRRTWTGPELVELEHALDAADQRAQRAAARARQRAALATTDH
jgi:hypothetical protein